MRRAMLSLPQENSAGLIQDISRNVSISLLYLHEVTSILHHRLSIYSPSQLEPQNYHYHLTPPCQLYASKQVDSNQV